MRWCLDGWYTARSHAEAMAAFYLKGGAAQAHVVEHRQWHTHGVVYLAAEPVADWHADPTAGAETEAW